MSNMHDFQYERSEWDNIERTELADETGEPAESDEGTEPSDADEVTDGDIDDDGGLFADDDKPAPKRRGPKPKARRH